MKQTLTTILTVVVTIAIMSLFGGGVQQPQREVFFPQSITFIPRDSFGNNGTFLRQNSDGTIDSTTLNGIDLYSWSLSAPFGGTQPRPELNWVQLDP